MKKTVSVRLDDESMKKAKDYAQTVGWSFTKLAEVAIAQYVNEETARKELVSEMLKEFKSMKMI
jgi:predicted transcriptional regulator